MKRLVWVLFVLSITSCNLKSNGNIPAINDPTSTPTSLKAVYLIQGQSQLSSKDLQAHPEVVIVQTFDEFKHYADQKVAFWVDKSATPFTLEQQQWINEAPQAYYPIVLVGTSDTLYAFKNLLGLCCFLGPAGDYPGFDKSGFSVIQEEETTDPVSPTVIFINGYDQTPTAQAILEITNALLEGRLEATPTIIFTPVATATIVP